MFSVFFCGLFLGGISYALGDNQDFVKNLLNEVGTNTTQIIAKKIYNEPQGIKICWKEVLYVNETTISGTLNLWQEYQIIFNFPAGDDDTPQNETSKQYKQYGVIRGEGETVAQEFEVIEKHENFTISKFETVTCAKGQFLSKTYQEWSGTEQKKIILKLSDIYFEADGWEIDGIDEIVGSPRKEGFNVSENTTFVDETYYNDDNGSKSNRTNHKATNTIQDTKLNLDSTQLQRRSVAKNLNETIPKDSNFKGTNKIQVTKPTVIEDGRAVNTKGWKNPSTLLELNNSMQSLRSIATNLNKTKPEDIKGLPSVDPCSPMLTQLLSGNGILLGLCNMKKNDSIILRGDIIISKKYFNETNRKEMEKPLYIIHENSEIEATN